MNHCVVNSVIQSCVVRVLSVIASDEFNNGIICVEKHSHKYNQRDVKKPVNKKKPTTAV